MWERGTIPGDLGWKILILIPKGNAETLGVGVLEFLCKMMKALIYTSINNLVTLHDFLHGFCAGRVTGTAIMELNLAQELVSVDQDPLLLVLLDLIKSYDNLDHFQI